MTPLVCSHASSGSMISIMDERVRADGKRSCATGSARTTSASATPCPCWESLSTSRIRCNWISTSWGSLRIQTRRCYSTSSARWRSESSSTHLKPSRGGFLEQGRRQRCSPHSSPTTWRPRLRRKSRRRQVSTKSKWPRTFGSTRWRESKRRSTTLFLTTTTPFSLPSHLRLKKTRSMKISTRKLATTKLLPPTRSSQTPNWFKRP